MIGSRTFIVTMSKNAFVGIRDSNPVRNAFLHQPNAFGLCPESLNDFVPIQEPVYAFHLVEKRFSVFRERDLRFLTERPHKPLRATEVLDRLIFAHDEFLDRLYLAYC